jgi:peptidoglycan-associated lipoprotein
MRKTLTIAAAALAIAAAGCARRAPVIPDTAPPVVDPNAGAGQTGADGGEAEPVELPAAQADLVAKAGSDTVYFATDEHALDQSARATLAAQARWMLANPTVRASIEGHCDERGTREYNLALGERRANAAKDFLIASGVPAARLLVVSWGKERPGAGRVVTILVR